ncbi:MAG: hypothetical protein JWO03_3402 [Bacteroidetes bacterium]|nr:hypothetical protein [Bacteroidota bacterium]
MKKLKLLSVLLSVSGLIYLSACSHGSSNSTSSLLVGTWSQNSEHSMTKYNGATTYDTTFTYGPGTTLTLTADGHFITPQYTTTYSVSGSKLTVYDIGSPGVVYSTFTVLTLDAHNFSYEIIDTPYFGTVTYDTHVFTR